MRCSRRSTTSFADAVRVIAALALALVAATVRASDDAGDAAVVAAITRAVQARVGDGFLVHVENLTARVAAGDAVTAAVPAPGSRLSQIIHFALVGARSAGSTGGTRRIGDAVARVRVTGPVVRAARDLARGRTLAADDIRVQEGEAGGAPLGPLPGPAEAIGAETRRPIRAGELLTPAVIRVAPLVESGQVVVAVAIVGSVGVEGRAIAAQHGGLGEIVRLVNPESRRSLRGRVIGPGRVEVLHEK